MTGHPHSDRDPFAKHPVLEAALPVGVLAALDEIGRLNEDERLRLATEFSLTIATHGDVLMYGGKSPQSRRDAAAAYAALARGLAALAHQPGGVTFGGLHWCVGSGHLGIRSESPCAAELAREAATQPLAE